MPDFPNLEVGGGGYKLNDIYTDISPQALGQLVDYVTQSGIPIPVSQIVGFPQQSRFLDRNTSTVDVANTAADTTVYSFDIPAGQMGTDRLLRMTLIGDALHNNVGTDTIIFRVKFGGTTFMQSLQFNFDGTTSTARQPWIWETKVANVGATNSQMLVSTLSSVIGQTPTAGIGAFRMVSSQMNFATGILGVATLGAIDTTVKQTLAVSVQWSASSANNSWRRRHALLELV